MPTRPDGDILPRLSDSCPRSADTTTVTPTTLMRWLPARCRARYHHVVRILSDTPRRAATAGSHGMFYQPANATAKPVSTKRHRDHLIAGFQIT